MRLHLPAATRLFASMTSVSLLINAGVSRVLVPIWLPHLCGPPSGRFVDRIIGPGYLRPGFLSAAICSLRPAAYSSIDVESSVMAFVVEVPGPCGLMGAGTLVVLLAALAADILALCTPSSMSCCP